ncbi:zinc ribbon domain-containing protein [candidate division KSB1 bacterium]|nr:zinc ribbon domain-containing protein [candidate division KSB1 bacterium]
MTILSIEKSDTTGEYYIYWGAIVFGIIDLIVGLTGWVSVKGEKENIQIAEYECTDCGADLTENDQVCPKCGADVSTLDENI